MQVRLGNSPVSWGVHYPDDPRNEPWRDVLDGIAQAGYRWIELGPFDYMPRNAALLRAELERRQLQAIAMYIFQPLTNDIGQELVLARAAQTCELLAEVGGSRLVIIDERNAERIPTAGRSGAGRRLDDEEFERLMASITSVARVASEHDVTPVLHPHVAGYVEFRDEIDRALEALDPDLVKLCIDTGHSAYAGIDPVDLFRDYADRVAYLHFKDIDGPKHRQVLEDAIDFDTAMREGVFCPLGEGVVDFRALDAALVDAGYDGWATVEQDHEPSDPDKAEKALRGAVESLAYLRGVGIAGDEEVAEAS
jgi:inosose dehydratase